MMNREIIPGKK